VSAEAPTPGGTAPWYEAARVALPRRRLVQIATSVADQGLVSVGTFLLNVLLARYATPTDYGVFVLASSAIIFSVDLQNSLLLEPLMVFGPAKEETGLGAYQGAVLLLQLWFTGILMALVWVGCLGWWMVGPAGPTLGTVAMMPLGMLGIQSREFIRKTFFSRLAPGHALRNDALYLALLLGGLALVVKWHRLTGSTAFALLAVAGVLTSAIGVLTVGIRFRDVKRQARSAAAEHWEYGRWMIGVSGARWSANELYYFVAAGFLGPAGSAALKAVQNVFAPIGLFLSGLGNVLLPVASRLGTGASLRSLNRFTVATGAVLGPLVLAYVIGVSVGSPFVFRVLYDGAYGQYAYLLPLVGAGHVLVAAFQGPSLGLRALQRPQAIFVITTLSAAATIVAVVPLTARFGLAGAIASMLLSLVISSPLWVSRYRRAVHERTRTRA
jgi:O-antigen/teichoic acid export membrane protein